MYSPGEELGGRGLHSSTQVCFLTWPPPLAFPPSGVFSSGATLAEDPGNCRWQQELARGSGFPAVGLSSPLQGRSSLARFFPPAGEQSSLHPLPLQGVLGSPGIWPAEAGGGMWNQASAGHQGLGAQRFTASSCSFSSNPQSPPHQLPAPGGGRDPVASSVGNAEWGFNPLDGCLLSLRWGSLRGGGGSCTTKTLAFSDVP